MMTNPGILSVEKVGVAFGGVRAVQGVSFEYSGGILGVIGPNGAGKTTLLNILTGLTREGEGKVSFRGLDLNRRNVAERVGLGIARTFQHPVLVPALTVAENLKVAGRRSPTAPSWKDLVTQLSLERWVNSEVRILPYGVRKLLDVVRAVTTGPTLLLCDEPLAGLDSEERERMLSILRRFAAEGMGILIVEHDVDRLSRVVDRLLVLDFGSVIAEGSPLTVLKDPRVVTAFLGGTVDDQKEREE